MWHLFQAHREEFLTHYHRRSNVEATFSALKRKFGGSLRSKKRTAQVNELLAKVLAYNLSVVTHAVFELGIDPGFGSPNRALITAVVHLRHSRRPKGPFGAAWEPLCHKRQPCCSSRIGGVMLWGDVSSRNWQRQRRWRHARPPPLLVA